MVNRFTARRAKVIKKQRVFFLDRQVGGVSGLGRRQGGKRSRAPSIGFSMNLKVRALFAAVCDQKLKLKVQNDRKSAFKRFLEFRSEWTNLSEVEAFVLFAAQSAFCRLQSRGPASVLFYAIKDHHHHRGTLSWTDAIAFGAFMKGLSKKAGLDKTLRQVRAKYPWDAVSTGILVAKLQAAGQTHNAVAVGLCFNLLLRYSHIGNIKGSDLFVLNKDRLKLRISHWKTEEDVATPAWFTLDRSSPWCMCLEELKSDFGKGRLLPYSTEKSILAQMKRMAVERDWPTSQKYLVHGLRPGGLQHRNDRGQPIEDIRRIGHWTPSSTVVNSIYNRGAIAEVK